MKGRSFGGGVGRVGSFTYSFTLDVEAPGGGRRLSGGASQIFGGVSTASRQMRTGHAAGSEDTLLLLFLKFGTGLYQVRPWREAKVAAAARLVHCVLPRMLVMCAFTVLTLICSVWAIIRLVAPWATSRSTSTSRAVRPTG